MFKHMILHLQPEVLETSNESPSSGHRRQFPALGQATEANMFVVPSTFYMDGTAAPRLF